MIVLTMDTPGGLDAAMRDIIQSILDSDIPVATYVFPQGSRAASAGTYILYASHVAAMAPATNLGAATPVQIGLPGLPTEAPQDSEPADSDTVPEGSTAMERKIMNDAIAYIRGLADLRGRNAEWAISAVTDAATLSANEALEQNVVDVLAIDLQDLLQQLDGRSVQVKDRTLILDTQDRPVIMDVPDWRAEFLSVITDPNLILILAMVGIYGLIIEFYNPGFGFAGITGAICLLLAGYGLHLLPINYAAVGLLLFGLILIISEAFIPSFGILGVGGIISFVIGSILLVDTEFSVFRVSLPLITAVIAATAILLVITLRIFLRIRRQPAVSGIESFIGHNGICMETTAGEGMVKVDGELWQALSDVPLVAGDKVLVEAVEGLHLRVRKI
jgi:membrane-bound serine protease (ClpP class)